MENNQSGATPPAPPATPTINPTPAPISTPINPTPGQTPLPPSTPAPAKPGTFFAKYHRIIFIGIAILLLIIIAAVLAFVFGFFKPNNISEVNSVTPAPQEKNEAALEGTLGINGVPPQGSYVNLLVKKEGEGNFETVQTSIAPVDGADWQWYEAEKGKEYEVKAQILANGFNIGESDVLFVTAPANSEILNVNVNITAIPSPTLNPTQTVQPTSTPIPQILSSISGTFNLNGYISTGTTISIAQRQVGSQSFANVASNLSATDGSAWSWTNAVQNTSYEIQATMIGPSGNVGQSQVLTVTAPAANETFTINSTAQSPQVTATGVSGTINFNGVAPSNSYVTIGQRVTGTTTFSQFASNLSATNNTPWSWTGAQSGTSYDFQAYLWINNQPASQSQILTVAAPATGEVLTINAQTQPSNTPSQSSITASCNSSNNAVVNFNINNALAGAQSFWLTIGTTGGGNQIISNIISPTTPNQTQTYTSSPLSPGQTYYVQYAYATCQNCTTFSPFSPSLPFTCN